MFNQMLQIFLQLLLLLFLNKCVSKFVKKMIGNAKFYVNRHQYTVV